MTAKKTRRIRFRVAFAAKGDDAGAFLARAHQRVRFAVKGKIIQFDSGKEIIKALKRLSARQVIDSIDVFSHAYDCGCIGSTQGGTGLYSGGTGRCAITNDKAADTTEFADAIRKQKIRIRNGGEICFWGCNTYKLAKSLSTKLYGSDGKPRKLLKCRRMDGMQAVEAMMKGESTEVCTDEAYKYVPYIFIIGSKGSVSPVIRLKKEVGARADDAFYSVKTGKRQHARYWADRSF